MGVLSQSTAAASSGAKFKVSSKLQQVISRGQQKDTNATNNPAAQKATVKFGVGGNVNTLANKAAMLIDQGKKGSSRSIKLKIVPAPSESAKASTSSKAPL